VRRVDWCHADQPPGRRITTGAHEEGRTRKKQEKEEKKASLARSKSIAAILHIDGES
jgi:hypothetical protein